MTMKCPMKVNDGLWGNLMISNRAISNEMALLVQLQNDKSQRMFAVKAALFCFVRCLLLCYAVKCHRIGIISVVQAAFDT